MNHTKTTTLGIATAITTVTIALLTAGVVVSITPAQTVYALNCVSSPNGKVSACSDSGSHSFINVCVISPPPSSTSISSDSTGNVHFSCSTGQGSESANKPGPSTSSGKNCF